MECARVSEWEGEMEVILHSAMNGSVNMLLNYYIVSTHDSH